MYTGNRFLVGFAFGVTVTVTAIALFNTTAEAQSALAVDCYIVKPAAIKAMESEWEGKMAEWLAQGKTKFVSNPGGVCAY